MNNDPNQPSQTPNVTPVPPPTAAPSVGASPVAPTPPPRKKTGLIIGIVAGVIGLLLLVGIGLFIMLALPGLQRMSAADSFLKAVTTGDIDKAVGYTDGESNRDFITHSAEKLKDASFKLDDSEFHNSGTSYYLFALTNSEQKSARVTVEFKDGHNLVTSLVYSPSQLKLTPSKVDDTADTPSKTPVATTEKCFAPSDYNHALGYSNSLTFNETSPYTTNVHFLPDSTDYDASYETGFMDTVANIVSDNPGKGYKIHLYGSVATSAASDKDFANQRAKKVKDYLASKGVSANNIVIDEPQNVDSMGGATNEVAKQMARAVVIKFAPDCTTTTSAASGR